MTIRTSARFVCVLVFTLVAARARAQATAGSGQVVRDTVSITSGGARLFLDLRGRADAPAVLLFLHGGPGQGVMGLLTVQAYPGPLLEQRHIIAYLHERGVLRSSAVPDSAQTVDAHVADVHRVVGYLRQRFPGRMLVIAGHSWGGLLTLLYASRHPQAPIAGLVLVAAPASFAHNERASYDTTLSWARRTRNANAVRELEAQGPPPYVSMQPMMVHRRWASQALPATTFQPSMARLLAAGGYSAPDSAWDAAAMRIGMAMLPQLLATDVRPALPALRLPLLAIAGGKDAVVMPGPMFDGLRDYGGPKRTVVFAESDHFLFMQEPERFAREVSTFVEGLNR